MPMISRSNGRIAAILALVATSGVALAHPLLKAAADEPLRCELKVARTPSGTALTALVQSKDRASGRYDFEVTGRGTDIRQGGPFAVRPGEPETLGTVTLGGGASFDAELTVTAGSRKATCEKRIGGAI